jgi:hypothetical protein
MINATEKHAHRTGRQWRIKTEYHLYQQAIIKKKRIELHLDNNGPRVIVRLAFINSDEKCEIVRDAKLQAQSSI